ncbi:Putative Holliday junction resolvase [Propionibacterium australiense]|uniref:Putative pre-16S rRNA nuclease n=1 Tax=Propionibacterium australiense TaxID=119981 RepID=A0A383S4C5_9ACTN|nr:Holliday junction resolvase [Propionibacterium australiense]VEH90639.1 Putative Holliday junction resolvase [Propionibacterium australiense]
MSPDAPRWRPGVRLCLDWGRARIGVAACDRDGVLAYPVATVPNDDDVMVAIRSLVADYQPLEIVMGLPTDLRGNKAGVAARAMRKNARRVNSETNLPVRMLDERLTTVAAARRLAATGKDARVRRSIIDQAAAVAILEQAIDMEKRSGTAPGEVIDRA